MPSLNQTPSFILRRPLISACSHGTSLPSDTMREVMKSCVFPFSTDKKKSTFISSRVAKSANPGHWKVNSTFWDVGTIRLNGPRPRFFCTIIACERGEVIALILDLLIALKSYSCYPWLYCTFCYYFSVWDFLWQQAITLNMQTTFKLCCSYCLCVSMALVQ